MSFVSFLLAESPSPLPNNHHRCIPQKTDYPQPPPFRSSRYLSPRQFALRTGGTAVLRFLFLLWLLLPWLLFLVRREHCTYVGLTVLYVYMCPDDKNLMSRTDTIFKCHVEWRIICVRLRNISIGLNISVYSTYMYMRRTKRIYRSFCWPNVAFSWRNKYTFANKEIRKTK